MRPRAEPDRRPQTLRVTSVLVTAKTDVPETFSRAFARCRHRPSPHRASDALSRCKSGTGLSSAITSAAPGIILVIAALSLIHCQTFGGNDNEDED